MSLEQVLNALDTARTQCYHYKAIIIAGMGLFTDAYDLFCIPPIMRLIGRVYYDDVDDPKKRYQVPIAITSAMVAIALLGAVIGQLVFGHLGDRMGRRRVYGITLMLMVLSSIGCGFSICTSPICVLTSLGFFRFLLGVGIGGDYPLSATIMSEFANRRTRGGFIAAVFSMQGFGILASSAVTMAICAIFDAASHSSYEKTPKDADWAWRLILLIGSIPAGLTFYWRMKMPETARYTALVEHNVLQAVNDARNVLDLPLRNEELPPYPPPLDYPFFSRAFFRRHGRDLFSSAVSWFLVDVVFYSTTLVLSQLNDQYLPKKENMNAYQDAYNVARFQALLAICSTIPGYFATVLFIDHIGRVKIQIMGFFFMAIALFAMGIPYFSYWYDHSDRGFLFLYGFTFFFSNFGPNTTTFIVPAELFPARFRSTCHGISGAFGKIGAIVGSIGFYWASQQNEENDHSNANRITAGLVILGGACIVGVITTRLFTHETMGRSLDDNENDDVA
ncbi:probable inorganic phosphate transporter 1-8 [Camellia sinensis]|nr:probable inorganic phosphate transporter 1-8 [Camellia sinensis]